MFLIYLENIFSQHCLYFQCQKIWFHCLFKKMKFAMVSAGGWTTNGWVGVFLQLDNPCWSVVIGWIGSVPKEWCQVVWTVPVPQPVKFFHLLKIMRWPRRFVELDCMTRYFCPLAPSDARIVKQACCQKVKRDWKGLVVLAKVKMSDSQAIVSWYWVVDKSKRQSSPIDCLPSCSLNLLNG